MNNSTPPNGDSPQLELALHHARGGLPVHPRDPINKGPYTKHGHLNSTTDEAEIIAWWTRRPNALVAIPTGVSTGYFVLDLDGPNGRRWLDALLADLQCSAADLSPYIVETPRNGLHLYFRLRPGERIASRAGDIAGDVDVRGDGGCIIVAGNRLPDGRQYRLIGPPRDISEARHAPRELVYRAMFNWRDRAAVEANVELAAEVAGADTANWPGILDTYRRAQVRRHCITHEPAASDAMRRQALSDLAAEATAYAGLRDGRRRGLFSVACRLVRYVVNEVITEGELRTALLDAAGANGAISTHGVAWFDGVLRRALAYGARDALPPLARRFREVM